MLSSRIKKMAIFFLQAIMALGFVLVPLAIFRYEKKTERSSLKEHIHQLAKKIDFDSIASYSIYSYPYKDLHHQLEEQNIKTLTVFSYGSLMSQASAQKTLSQKALSTRKPAIAFGIKRLFNRDVKIRYNSKWGVPKDPDARGMLNIEMTNKALDIVNGVVYEIDIEEIPSMLDREEGYDLVPVFYLDWEDIQEQGQPKLQVAYTFRAKNLSSYTSCDILPRPNYYELTRDAAKEYGPEFYAIWLESTYYADGITTMLEHPFQGLDLHNS